MIFINHFKNSMKIRAAYIFLYMLLVSKRVREHKHYELTFEKQEDLPEIILSYYRKNIPDTKELLL
jgi:hypothetical protein